MRRLSSYDAYGRVTYICCFSISTGKSSVELEQGKVRRPIFDTAILNYLVLEFPDEVLLH